MLVGLSLLDTAAQYESMAESHFTPLLFGKYILIGRKSCNISLNDIRISNVHCEVGSVKMESWDMFPPCTAYVEDKSSNGTWMCRKEGLNSWGAYRKLTKGVKINFSPGDIILLLPPSIDAPDYYAFLLEANELCNEFGLKHLTATELKERTTKVKNGSLTLEIVQRSSFSADVTAVTDACVNKKFCLAEPVKLESCSKPDLKVAPPPEIPPITTQGSWEQCPNCLYLFPLEELVKHSESCTLSSEHDKASAGDVTSAAIHPPSLSAGGTAELEQCMHCLKDFSVIELVTHVNVCPNRIEPMVYCC